MTAELRAPGIGNVYDAHYLFEQNVPSSFWLIDHGLGKKPSVTIVDSADTQVEGTVDYVDDNSLTVSFAVAFSGRAYLN